MKIDAHNHANWLQMGLDATLENMEHCGIDKTVLLSWDCPRDEYDPAADYLYNNTAESGPLDFAYALDFYTRHPDKFYLGYAPDPRRPHAKKQLQQALQQYPICIYGELKIRMTLDNWDAIELYRFCGEIGLPVVLHLEYPLPLTKPSGERDNYWYCGDIDTLERVLTLCPETKFLGHAPGFWAHISKDTQMLQTSYPEGPVLPGGRIEELLAKHRNLYCDISAYSGVCALSRDTAYTKRLILAHPDRFIYARDCFDNSHAELLEQLALPEEVQAKIYAENFLQIAKL